MKKISEEGKVSFLEAIKDFYRGYFDFKGRSTRAGYWWVQLATAIVYFILFVIMVIEVSTSNNFEPAISPFLVFVFVLFTLSLIIPNLALSVRRLRDVGLKSKTILTVYIAFYALYGTVMLSMYTSLLNTLSNTISTIAANGYGYTDSYGVGTTISVASSPLVTFLMLAVGMFISVAMFLATDTLATKSNHSVLISIFRKK